MPYITIFGIPDSYGVPKDALANLTEKVIDATLAITELNIPKRSNVTVYFPMDMLDSKQDRNIFVEIQLFDKPEQRTKEVCNSLARSIWETLVAEFPNKVRCKCILIDETDGWCAG